MTDTIEILAPAGSYEAFLAAVNSGADAVYFGGSNFSARKNAANFTNEEIKMAVEYAHLRNVSLYVAVNTLLHDDELQEAFDFIKFCYESGIDGLIVQDLGVIHLLQTYFPDFRMHASTQMTIHNLSGAQEAKRLGFKRVVLSRELSLEEIRYIAQNCDIELEVFVHGALCMSYSGQCLFSSFLGGRSGNRGLCAQPCRLPYTLFDADGNRLSEKNKYILSLKDLCLIDEISKLKEAGVKSFKIEGRMKSAAYVSAVCGIYHKYRDGSPVEPEDYKLLEDIFSRSGFTKGYYADHTGREMLNYDKSNDNIYDTATDDVVERAGNVTNVQHEKKLKAKFTLYSGKTAHFEAEYAGKIFCADGTVPASPALHAALTEQRAEEQLLKLGSTVFSYDKLDIELEEGLHIPVKEINSVRRSVTEQIERYILGDGRCYSGADMTIERSESFKLEPELTASVLTAEQAAMAYDLGFSKIYIPFSVYASDPEQYDGDSDVYCVRLDPINRDKIPCNFEKIKTVQVCITNIGQLGKIAKSIKRHADYRMNLYNTLSLKQLIKLGFTSACLSPELSIVKLQAIAKVIPSEIVVYGKIPLMTVQNCVIKSALGKCGCKEGNFYYLKDRKDIQIPVLPQKGQCYNVLYNSAPIYMADRMKELSDIGAAMYRFEFTTEQPQEMEEIMRCYEHGTKNDGFFTRGHFYKGVL